MRARGMEVNESIELEGGRRFMMERDSVAREV